MTDPTKDVIDQRSDAGTPQDEPKTGLTAEAPDASTDTSVPVDADAATDQGSTDQRPTDRKPTRTSTDSAWAAMRRADERARRAEAEVANLKRQAAAGARPEPPDPSQYTDAMGAIKPREWQKAQRDHEDRLHTWRQAQAGTSSPAPSTTSDVVADESTLAERASIFLERAESLRTQHADFDTVVNTPVFTASLRDAIFESEQGPEIAYFLGKNPTEANRIGGLPPSRQLREIGRLEAKLSADRRTVSNAPEPITPVRGSTGSVEKDPEKMSIDEYMAWEGKRRLERLKTSPLG